MSINRPFKRHKRQFFLFSKLKRKFFRRKENGLTLVWDHRVAQKCAIFLLQLRRLLSLSLSLLSLSLGNQPIRWGMSSVLWMFVKWRVMFVADLNPRHIGQSFTFGHFLVTISRLFLAWICGFLQVFSWIFVFESDLKVALNFLHLFYLVIVPCFHLTWFDSTADN